MNSLILFTNFNQGRNLLSQKGSNAILIQQVNPVIWGNWVEKKKLFNILH